ncbi:pirin family protein [Anthocerotibacter panamensis]|uniref:pirin family protein n=1 Tax=Anthocerotibacter panamensis TaxID=2857077 RepID=UPI001C408CA9|nr:pirin family protein [Anthocerotibacter panamensis]
MITLRPADKRGHADHGWLDSHHTFSFANYYDPEHMGFRALRVLNEDRVKPGHGFDTHSHRDMEIITYVLEGVLAHKDSMGNQAVIYPGEVQRMSAGTGVTHSEYNHSSTEPVHFLQIWILPQTLGIPPSYQQRAFAPTEGAHRQVVARQGDVVTVHQDMALSIAHLATGQETRYPLASNRHAWVQIARGSVLLNGQPLQTGDGAAISQEALLIVQAQTNAEVLLFDLA